MSEGWCGGWCVWASEALGGNNQWYLVSSSNNTTAELVHKYVLSVVYAQGGINVWKANTFRDWSYKSFLPKHKNMYSEQTSLWEIATADWYELNACRRSSDWTH